MAHGFSGDVATYYARYRRGYPPAAVDAITEAFALTTDDLVVDLGGGTGQLSLPLATRVRAVVGMDPEPDMLALARRGAQQRGAANISWILGADTDLPALDALFGNRTVGAVTIAVAIHWMDRATVFRAARPLLRPGGGIAVITNGTPLWLQDTEWSRTLQECLQRWRGLENRRPTSARPTRQAVDSTGKPWRPPGTACSKPRWTPATGKPRHFRRTTPRRPGRWPDQAEHGGHAPRRHAVD